MSLQPDGESALISAIHRVALATSGGDREVTANVIIVEAASLLGAGDGAIFVWDQEDLALVPINPASHPPPDGLAQGTKALIQKVFESGRPSQVEGVPASGTGLAVPMTLAGQPVGCLLVWSKTISRFSSAAIDRLGMFANLAAQYWEMLPPVGNRRPQDTADMNHTVARSTESLSPAQLMIGSVVHALRADVASLHWWDPGTKLLRSCSGTGTTEDFNIGMVLDNTLSDRVFRLGRAMAVDDFQSWPHEVPDSLGHGLQHAVAAPLLVDGRPVGTLTGYRRDSQPFLEQDIERLSVLCRLVAPSIDPSQLEMEGKAKEELMALALANAPMIFNLINHDRVITHSRGGGLDRIGDSPEFSCGKRFDIGGSNPEITAAITRALGGAHTQIEWTSGLSSTHWATYLAPILDGTGRVKEACAVSIDISDQWEANEAKRESEAKSRFLAVMSHEVRTPLNSIMGFAQLLQLQGDRDERESRYVQNLMDAGNHLLSLINDLLDLAKIQAGQLTISLESHEMRELVTHATDLISPLIVSNSLTLDTRVPGRLEVMADKRHLHQVLVNLLSNAAKFTNPGGKVRIAAEAAGRWVEIRISDTGVGLAPADQERVFEEFAQASANTSRPQRGTGLGLPVSRRLVELMGGRLTMESELGVGSTFTVRLPAGGQPAPVQD